MKQRGQFTYSEITTQADAWESALAHFGESAEMIKSAWSKAQPKSIILVGCGSTHYLAQSAAILLQRATGVRATALPSSEVALDPLLNLSDTSNVLFVAISRSGTTTETLQAVEQYRKQGGTDVWTITCYPDSPLAQAADLVLAEPLAQEQSVAQTRSFATMLLFVQALAGLLGGEEWEVMRDLPNIVHKLLTDSAELTTELGRRTDFSRLYFLGSSAQFGVANEAMLKMTETSLTHAQGFHFMEFRHGPMSMASEDALVIGLVSAERRKHDEQVLKEMHALGAAVLAITPHSEPIDVNWQLCLPDNLPNWALPALYLPPLQMLAYQRSMAKGLDPDNPRNLEAVVYLDTALFV